MRMELQHSEGLGCLQGSLMAKPWCWHLDLLHCFPKSQHLLGHRWDTMAWLGVGLYVGSDPRAGWCSPYLEHASWSLCFMRHLVPVLL